MMFFKFVFIFVIMCAKLVQNSDSFRKDSVDRLESLEMSENALKKSGDIVIVGDGTEMSKNYNVIFAHFNIISKKQGNIEFGDENDGNVVGDENDVIDISKKGVKNLGDVVILGDGIAQRMEENQDDKVLCHGTEMPGGIRCSPALGGGCCPPMFPACCGNGIHCRKTGPC